MYPDRNADEALTQEETNQGLRLVIGDGLCAEVMTTLTSGAFLVAMAILLGANNFEIGLFSSLPLLTNVAQLASVWLVQRFNSRKLVTVAATVLARIPLLVIGVLPLVLGSTNVTILMLFLFFNYLFGSIAGPAWNSWMKDLIPEEQLGGYFARRGSYTQMLNVALSIAAAITVDHIKSAYPQYELITYAVMFLVAGVVGLYGAVLLSKVKEPPSLLTKENIFSILKRPLRDLNFKRLLIFNCAWVFALNIATPFFTVFMLQTMRLSLLVITGLMVLGQLAGIFSIRLWGIFTDRYSNKTIIAVLAPLYLCCIVAWCFVGNYSHLWANLLLLAFIHIVSGVATSGINLSLTNIGLKLAPKNDAIVYLSAKNIFAAAFSAIAPIIGGYMADYFRGRSLIISGQWAGPIVNKSIYFIKLHQYNFLFLIGGVLAFLSLELLVGIYEKGEVAKTAVVRILRSSIRNNLKETFLIGNIVDIHYRFWGAVKKRRKRRRKLQAAEAMRRP
jgi:MFS family permease